MENWKGEYNEAGVLGLLSAPRLVIYHEINVYFTRRLMNVRWICGLRVYVLGIRELRICRF